MRCLYLLDLGFAMSCCRYNWRGRPLAETSDASHSIEKNWGFKEYLEDTRKVFRGNLTQLMEDMSKPPDVVQGSLAE